ncbi:hypothetical protein Aple_054920 [Acrocarpospora pleiomorpha]|uniref:Uncharacterized protein n=1 Tax=Acrocarpospora pleiomorpha TaxID=90975 RepID=A0A5M3XMX9_9ACTN|nr:hypothetical protein Aple_054920 [Acrocarpospora pleiomorpha]
MRSYRRWRDTDHLHRAIESAGGVEQVEAEAQCLRQESQGLRLAVVQDRSCVSGESGPEIKSLA